jgi:hypothetical protein
VLLWAGIAVLLLTSGCSTLANNVNRLNEAATRAASGDLGLGTGLPILPTAAPTTAATPAPPNTIDLTNDPAALLVHAWGITYGLASGSQFTILATEQQVGDYIVRALQLSAGAEIVRGGSAKVDLGQIRIDLAMQDSTGKFGAGTATFQPTLDEFGRVRLNPQGADFAGMQIPDNFTAALGDTVHAALTGAQNDSLSRVTLSLISLDGGVMKVSGTLR